MKAVRRALGAALIPILALLALAPTASATGMMQPAYATSTFKGYARVCYVSPATLLPINDPNYAWATPICDPGDIAGLTTVGWRWNSRYGWQQSTRAAGEKVWVWPYAGGWSWTWTSSKGWLAMRSDRLMTGHNWSACAPGGPCSGGFTPIT